ncbi:hypothetical protein D1872_255930 [compost metagenome]
MCAKIIRCSMAWTVTIRLHITILVNFHVYFISDPVSYRSLVYIYLRIVASEEDFIVLQQSFPFIAGFSAAE